MFVPNYRTATREEEDTYFPQSGFDQYLSASLVDEFVETSIGGDLLRFEATKAEIEAYPDIAQELIDADVAHLYPHLPFTDPRKEARANIAGLPRLNKEQWQNSQFYRKGMTFEPDITEARLKVYSEWYDANAARENVIERRNAGFWEGTTGFLAGMVGAAADPMNLISVGVAPGAALGKKVGIAALENVGAELAVQLSTMDIRAEAGIAPTTGERMLNVAFAAIIGGAFGAGTHVFHSRAKKRAKTEGISIRKAEAVEPTPVLRKNKEGIPDAVEIKDARPNVNNLTEKTIQNLTQRQKFDVMARLDKSFSVLARGPDVPRLDPQSLEGPLDVLDPFQRVISDVLSGDQATTEAILNTINLNDKSVREALIPDLPVVEKADAKVLPDTAQRVDKMAVGDDQNISLEEIDTPTDDPLLQGETLFSVADKQTDDFESGLEKAVELINSDGCR